MEIRHLTTFLQVAMMENFTRAGETLGYTQANVSLQIRQLEDEIGVPLFDRIGKKAHLTQYGQMLIPYAQRIVSTSTEIENLFKEKETLGGTLRIGFAESLFECIFTQTILEFHRQFPCVTVDVTVDATSELLKKLNNGQLDMACLIDNSLADPGICYWEALPCSIVIVASPDHPLAASPHISAKDLNGREFVLMEESAPYILEFNRWLLRENISIVPFIKVQSPDAALELISKEKHLTVLPDYSVNKAAKCGQLVKLDVSGFSQTQYVQFLVHKNKVLTPQIDGFFNEAFKAFTASQEA